MDIVHPERKKVFKELQGNNSTASSAGISNSTTNSDSNTPYRKQEVNSDTEQKNKSDL